MGISDLWAYVLGTVAIVLLPGPNSMFVLSVAARQGVRAGYTAACGVFVGDAILMTLASIGAASVLKALPALFMAIKVVGAAYLAWIGFNLLRSAAARWRRAELPVSDRSPDALQPFRRALVISLLNPKAILFFVSFFIQFVEPDSPNPALSFFILGVIAQVISALYLSSLIFGGSRLSSSFARHRRGASAATASVGLLFLGFGAKLATASMN